MPTFPKKQIGTWAYHHHRSDSKAWQIQEGKLEQPYYLHPDAALFTLKQLHVITQQHSREQTAG